VPRLLTFIFIVRYSVFPNALYYYYIFSTGSVLGCSDAYLDPPTSSSLSTSSGLCLYSPRVNRNHRFVFTRFHPLTLTLSLSLSLSLSSSIAPQLYFHAEQTLRPEFVYVRIRILRNFFLIVFYIDYRYVMDVWYVMVGGAVVDSILIYLLLVYIRVISELIQSAIDYNTAHLIITI
jgi:hypothetical protein